MCLQFFIAVFGGWSISVVIIHTLRDGVTIYYLKFSSPSNKLRSAAPGTCQCEPPHVKIWYNLI